VQNIWSTNGGIFLGYATNTNRDAPSHGRQHPIYYTDDRHILTFGPNGSGKTRRALRKNLIDLTGWSALVIDPKGELARDTGAAREKEAKANGGEVFYLNPYKVPGIPKNSPYNPLLSLDPGNDNFVDDAMRLAEAVITLEGHNEPHWPASAQDLFSAFIMYCVLSGDCRLRTIREDLGLSMSEFRRVIGFMRLTGAEMDWDELTVKASRFLDIDPENKELASIVSTALTQTRWLDSRAIKNHTDSGTIPFKEMKTRPITVYLILPANRLVTQNRWLRLVITSCIQALMEDANAGSVPVLLALEEAAAIGHLPIIEDTMAMMRGYGIKLWSIFQDASQLEDIYEKRWESFIANAGVLQAFAPRDVKTAKFLSDLAGQKTVEVENEGASSGMSGFSFKGLSLGANTSKSKIAVPDILPQELMRMDMGYTALFSHKTKGISFAYLPDPSEAEG
jgi:type IV secretion system protein VirD4